MRNVIRHIPTGCSDPDLHFWRPLQRLDRAHASVLKILKPTGLELERPAQSHQPLQAIPNTRMHLRKPNIRAIGRCETAEARSKPLPSIVVTKSEGLSIKLSDTMECPVDITGFG